MVNVNNHLSKLELIAKLEIDIDYDKKKDFFLNVLVTNFK